MKLATLSGRPKSVTREESGADLCLRKPLEIQDLRKAIGQLTLTHGANDLGSTMMEESVVSAAGTVHALTRRDLDEMITGAGFEPALRDNGYRVLD